MRKISLILSLWTLQGFVHADPFFDDHERGWFWYEDPQVLEDEKLEKPLPQKEVSPKEEKKPEAEKTAVERLKEVTNHLNELKAKAILEPTIQNVQAYQEYQMKVVNQSQKFSKAWMYNVIQDPTLDDEVKNPALQTARFAVYEKENEEIQKMVASLKESYGLFYFYSGACKFCDVFTPLVKSFADKHGWEVLAISMDGAPSKVFSNWQVDNGIAANMKISTVPSLFAINPQTGHVIPIANAPVGVDVMEKRIVSVMKFEGEQLQKNRRKSSPYSSREVRP